MFKSIGRRLQVQFGSPDPLPDPGGEPSDARPEAPPIDFVAFGADVLLSGNVALQAERLTDMLNDHDEYLLTDVTCHGLGDAVGVEVPEFLIRRDELLLVHATGPRGNRERRISTRAVPMVIQIGPYRLRGDLHTRPGTEPLDQLRRRKAMVPMTDAWLEFEFGGQLQERRLPTIIVNRELIDWIKPAANDGFAMLSLPTYRSSNPMVKDFTGNLFS